MKRRLLLLVCVCSLFSLSAGVAAKDRVALVVGCGKYRAESVPELETPPQDARDLTVLLNSRALGFDAIQLLNPTTEEFYTALHSFKERAKDARVALFFFSGHGIESDGQNYLIPVNATLDTQAQLETQAVNLERVMKDLSSTNAAVKVAVLDCCRNNPFATTKSWMKSKAAASDGVLRALGEAEIPQASLVCFATSAGRKAAAVLKDDSKNSPFTEFLLDELPKSGQSLRTIFENVHDRLKAATAGRQVPTVRTDNALSELFRQTMLVKAKAPLPTAYFGALFPPRTNEEKLEPKGKGVPVDDVIAGSPAFENGLRPGDVVVAVDDEEVGTVEELLRRMTGKRPGNQVLIKYLRESKESTLTATLAALPDGLVELRQARDLANVGKYREALDLLTRGINSRPRDQYIADLYLERAGIYLDLKDYPHAIDDAGKTIERKPNAPSAYAYRARAFKALGKSAEADADEKKAKELKK